jgi:hypothetical protein
MEYNNYKEEITKLKFENKYLKKVNLEIQKNMMEEINKLNEKNNCLNEIYKKELEKITEEHKKEMEIIKENNNYEEKINYFKIQNNFLRETIINLHEEILK